MTQERINKLRELADRGIEGEKDNARAILTRLGISWKKPSTPIVDKVKSTFGGNIIRDYYYNIDNPTDPLFMGALLTILTKNNLNATLNNNRLHIKCTFSENEDIKSAFFKHRDTFFNSMVKETWKYVNDYIGK